MYIPKGSFSLDLVLVLLELAAEFGTFIFCSTSAAGAFVVVGVGYLVVCGACVAGKGGYAVNKLN